MRKWGKINFAKIVCAWLQAFHLRYATAAAAARAHVAYRFHIKSYFPKIYFSLSLLSPFDGFRVGSQCGFSCVRFVCVKCASWQKSQT